jgi:hypothetical protein
MDRQSCKSSDLVMSWKAVLLWGLPVAALIVGSYWQKGRTAALDSGVLGDGSGLSSECGAMWQSSLLHHGSLVAVCDRLRRPGEISSCTDGCGIFSGLHFGGFHPRFSR